jgi:tRNA(Ile)-lysidine synthase
MTDPIDHINLDKKLTYIVACSGGLDSAVLLYLLKKKDYNVRVIHMNYGLRGGDSDKDEEFVQNLCDELDVSLDIRRSKMYGTSTEKINIQLETRNERYQWFEEILERSKNNRIALGHHQDDQIETFYLNLSRGAGVLGLSAMLPEHNGIVRPMLNIGKEELIQYASDNDIHWCEDSSNAESKYRRNKLRNVILPELYSSIPDLKESVLLIITKMQELQLELEQRCKSIAKSAMTNGVLLNSDIKNLNDLELIELFRQLGVTYNEHLEVLKTEKTGGIVKVNSPDFDIIAKERDGYSLISSNAKPSIRFETEDCDELPKRFNKQVLYLDKNKIIGDLKIRVWEIGDRIKPVGLDGSKLVSKVIKEGKLSTKDKLRCVVLTDSENILWVPGLSVGRTALADHNSQEIMKVSISPQEPQV